VARDNRPANATANIQLRSKMVSLMRRPAMRTSRLPWLAVVFGVMTLLARGDVLVCTNGERFTGTVIAETAANVVFESELGERMTFSRAKISEIQQTPPAAINSATISLVTATNPPSTLTHLPATNNLSWKPPGVGHDGQDWIEIKTDSWLSGRLKYLQDRQLEFENDQLGEQSFDLSDILQVYPARPAWAMFYGRKKSVFGTIVISNDLVEVSGQERLVFPRSQLLGLTTSGVGGTRYWSGNVSLGLSLQSGINTATTLTTSFELARRTPNTELMFDYNGNYSEASGVQSANNQRIDSSYNIRLDRHWFVRPGELTFYYDPLYNIAFQGMAAVGGGYYFFERRGLTWYVAAGPAGLYTRFEEVQPNQADSATTPAATLQTYLKADITRHLTLIEKVQGVFTTQEAGWYSQYAISTLQYKIHQNLDLDVSLVWNYLQNPRQLSNGETPSKNNTFLSVSFGVNF
jgi:Protein of unknown function, DUF481